MKSKSKEAKRQAHRSTLKQTNKKHNKLGHKTKGQIRALVQGRSESLLTICNKPRRELNKFERSHQKKQIRHAKKEKTLTRKQSLGTDKQPPFLVSIIMLNPDINPKLVIKSIQEADPGAPSTPSEMGNITHISSPWLKRRFTLVLPPIDDLYAILDAVKVSSSVLMVWPACERGEQVLSEEQEKILSAIKAQGLPTPIHAVLGYQDMPQKKKSAGYQNLLNEVNHYFPGHGKEKIFQLDVPGENKLCLRQIALHKERSLFFRDHRAHLLAEKVEFKTEENSSTHGVLSISGYIRGVPFSPSSLVHIPGWGDYQFSHITVHGKDPRPLTVRKGNMEDSSDTILYPDPQQQESLNSIRDPGYESDNEEDSSDSGSEMDDGSDNMNSIESLDTKSSINELTSIPTKTSRVPKSVNTYMASWYLEDVNYGSSDEEGIEGEDEFEAPAPFDDVASTVCGDDEDDRMSVCSEAESMQDNNYDEKIDYDEERDEYLRMKEAREDLEYPEEVEAPFDIPARKRFHKYRGLESFKSSPWDLSENLPEDYGLIFNIPQFNEFRKRILKYSSEIEGANPGSYVTLHIAHVEFHKYMDYDKTRSPLVAFGLLPHENKMSLGNYVLNSHSSGHYIEIKSKDNLVFHVGFRRFRNRPIFSEHSAGDKQKFVKFFRPKSSVIASMYAPITYPPASVLVFREKKNGCQDLVATGSVYNCDVNRCILKKIILTAHPFKIHKRTVVARYMFHDRDDINWYKPIELRTKYGKKGKIKEALGTHGHMKCQFNGILKSQDTILLTLYKRMYPKWKYDTYVPRPPPLYANETLAGGGESENKNEDTSPEEVEKKRDTMLMPPPVKRVRFN